MSETEPDRYNRKRKPREGAHRDGVEFLVDEIAQQKSAPENFLDQRDDDDEAKKPQENGGPVSSWLTGKSLGIEPVGPWRKTEKSLGRNPERENEERNRNGESDSAGGLKLILAPKQNEKRAADDRLRRVNPIFRRSEPKGAARLLEKTEQGEQSKKNRHRQRECHQLAPVEFVTRRIHLVFWLNG